MALRCDAGSPRALPRAVPVRRSARGPSAHAAPRRRGAPLQERLPTSCPRARSEILIALKYLPTRERVRAHDGKTVTITYARTSYSQSTTDADERRHERQHDHPGDPLIGRLPLDPRGAWEPLRLPRCFASASQGSRRKSASSPTASHARRSSRNSDAGSTPVTRSSSLARVQAT
jgi:hypothetical protein